MFVLSNKKKQTVFTGTSNDALQVTKLATTDLKISNHHKQIMGFRNKLCRNFWCTYVLLHFRHWLLEGVLCGTLVLRGLDNTYMKKNRILKNQQPPQVLGFDQVQCRKGRPMSYFFYLRYPVRIWRIFSLTTYSPHWFRDCYPLNKRNKAENYNRTISTERIRKTAKVFHALHKNFIRKKDVSSKTKMKWNIWEKSKV